MALRAWGTAVRRVGDSIAASIRFAIAFAAHGRMSVAMSLEVWGVASVQAGERRGAQWCVALCALDFVNHGRAWCTAPSAVRSSRRAEPPILAE